MGAINDFWNGKRYLFYGYSRDTKSIAREIHRKLSDAGLELIPIRDDIDEIDGRRMVKNPASVEGNVDGAFIAVSPESAGMILDGLRAGKITRVFFQIGAYSKDVIEKAEAGGFDYETGCALTRFDRMGFPHSTHRWMARRFGGMK